jgi:hypothetical protein
MNNKKGDLGGKDRHGARYYSHALPSYPLPGCVSDHASHGAQPEYVSPHKDLLYEKLGVRKRCILPAFRLWIQAHLWACKNFFMSEQSIMV